VLLVRYNRRHIEAGSHRRARRLLFAFLAVTPLAVIVGVLADLDTFFAYLLPLLIIAVEIALFIGIARLRFYDIDVRAARSGALAADAAELARLAIAGELTASFAHEVRNPLTGVRSLTQRIADGDVDESKRRQYASVILEEVGRIEQIVENLLRVSRRQPRLPWSGEATPLEPLFEDVRLLVSPRAQRAGANIEVSARSLAGNAPREALAQALLNLALNAIAHSPAGGCVRIDAERCNDGVAIIVSDEGPGVPAAERERIFEPFYSRRPDGTGLGLSVVRRLSRQLGWTVTVSDAARGGAQFRLHIPNVPIVLGGSAPGDPV